MDELGALAALPRAVEQALRELEPSAVLLHGSRAVGRGRRDSDWDVCVLVDGESRPRWRSQRVGGVWLDLGIVSLRATDAVVTELFGTSLRSAQVLADSGDGAGAALVARARALHEKGRQVPKSTLRLQAAHAERVARRMAGTADKRSLFFFHLSTFFGLAVSYWFDREGRWPEAPDEALESIRAADPEYASLLDDLAGDAGTDVKTQAAGQIAGRLVDG